MFQINYFLFTVKTRSRNSRERILDQHTIRRDYLVGIIGAALSRGTTGARGGRGGRDTSIYDEDAVAEVEIRMFKEQHHRERGELGQVALKSHGFEQSANADLNVLNQANNAAGSFAEIGGSL